MITVIITDSAVRGRDVELTLTEKVRIFLQLNSGVSVSKEHLAIIRDNYLANKE